MVLIQSGILQQTDYRITEHLGLIPPQPVDPDEPVSSFMKPAPTPNDDTTGTQEDALVADPLGDQCLSLWAATAKKNREIFTEVFRPVPTNLVRGWSAYDVSDASACHSFRY